MRAHAPGTLLLGSDFKALGVARSLGRRGVPIGVVDNLPRSAWFSRFVSKRFKWSGPMFGPAFLDFLVGLAHREGMEGWVLFPAQDETLQLVARNCESLSTVYRLVTQPWSVLKWAHNKKLLNVIADGAGVPHPRTWYPSSEEQLLGMQIEYPAIIKPATSIDMQYALGRKALRVDNADDLVQCYRRARSVVKQEDIMVQELVTGGAQCSVAAFCDEGAVMSAITARRTRQYPYDFGLSSSFVEAVELPDLLEPSRRLLRRLGSTGMVEVEFVRNGSGEAKLLDVNPRPFGWHTLCIACGLDLPWMQYGYALGRRPVRAVPSYGKRWMRVITDVPAVAQYIRAGLMSPIDYLRSLGGKTVFSVLDPLDPLPVLGDLAVVLRRVVAATADGRGLASAGVRPGISRPTGRKFLEPNQDLPSSMPPGLGATD